MGGQAFVGSFPESRAKPLMYMTVDPNEQKIHYHRSDKLEEVETLSYEDADLLNGLTTALVAMRMK